MTLNNTRPNVVLHRSCVLVLPRKKSASLVIVLSFRIHNTRLLFGLNLQAYSITGHRCRCTRDRDTRDNVIVFVCDISCQCFLFHRKIKKTTIYGLCQSHNWYLIVYHVYTESTLVVSERTRILRTQITEYHYLSLVFVYPESLQ